MTDDTLGEFGFDVDTAGLRAGSDAMSALEARTNSAAAAIERFEAASARAFAASRMSPAMMAAMGPSPAGGSMGGTMGVAGLSAAQLSAVGASATALTTALHAPVAPLGSLAAAVQAATASLHALSQVQPPPRMPAPSPASPASPSSSSAPSSPGSRPSSSGGGTSGNGHGGGTGTGSGGSHGGGASYGNTLQMMELAHVGRALFDEMAAGGNVLRGLATEFGRLQIAVSSGEGGITGMLGRVGSGIAGIVNPATLAIGAVGALGAASALAFGEYESGQSKLESSLNMLGRRSGATREQLTDLATSSAARGGLSTSEGINLAARYTGAGLSAGLTGQLIGVTHDYSRITDQSAEKGGAALAEAFRDPIRGIGDLDRQFGFLDDRMKAQVEDLVRSGHLAEAQALELSALTRAMKGAEDQTWSFSRSMSGAWNGVSNFFGSMGHGVANALGYGSDEENLAKNKGLLQQLQTFDPSGNGPDIAALKHEMARLEVGIGKSQSDALAKDGRDIEVAGKAGDAIRTILPEVMRGRSAADTVEVLRMALADPGVMGHLDPNISPAMVGRAYSQASVLQDINRPGRREAVDYSMNLSRVRDSGVQDSGLDVARRAELEVLRSTGDVVRAATAAQRAYTRSGTLIRRERIPVAPRWV